MPKMACLKMKRENIERNIKRRRKKIRKLNTKGKFYLLRLINIIDD